MWGEAWKHTGNMYFLVGDWACSSVGKESSMSEDWLRSLKVWRLMRTRYDCRSLKLDSLKSWIVEKLCSSINDPKAESLIYDPDRSFTT
jgi:hypothetical protein